jgi:hypothetical protein
MGWLKLPRIIREEPKFSEQVKALALDHKRLDEVLTGAYFALANGPENFPVVPGTSLSVLKTDVYPNAPALRIFFTYNIDEVHLITIEFTHEED